MRLDPNSRLGPYEIIALLGAGGMGEVYRARDSRLGREVAVKALPAALSRDPDRLRRFEQEARTASALNHPNIVAIYDVGTIEDCPYIVSELLEGETLRERLAGAALPPRKAIDYAIQIARGLAAAHQKGIVHRDLKPENAFVTHDGRVKILDFGLAKLTATAPISEDSSTVAMGARGTDPGVVMGTVGYMSPEQVRGQATDARTDMFAFGAMLYEMLAGRRAFQGPSSADIMSAILKEDPPPLADRSLDRLVRRCLEKSPDERFQSARDLAFDLEAVAEGSGPQPAATPVRRVPAPLLAAAILAASCLAAFFAGRTTGAPASPASPVFHQLTFGRGFVEAAAFAPDGQTIVYSASWEGKPMESFETRLGSPGSRSLFQSAGLLSISSSAELALSLGCEMNWGHCQGTLARVPLAGGAPRPVLDQVDFADWAKDGNSIAVVVRANEGYQIEFPIGTVWYKSKGWIAKIAVSRAGDRIAFFEHPALGDVAGSLTVVDRTGKKEVLLTGWQLGDSLAWAPGEREIWFSGTRTGRQTNIYAVSLSGAVRKVFEAPGGVSFYDIFRDGRALVTPGSPRGGIICLAPGQTRERELSWFDWSTVADLSSDGKTLLFSEWGDAVNAVSRVYLRPTDGSAALDLGEGKALALSPDGKWALAVQEQASPPRLVLLPTGAGQAKTLPPSGIPEYSRAFWFPDGKRVSFVGSGPGRAPRSYLQDIDGGNATPLTDENTIALLVSPDGKQMVINSFGAYFLVPDHGERVAIQGLEDGDAPVQWTADGRGLYVRGTGEFSAPIYRLDLATGQRKLWKVLAPPDNAGAFNVAPYSALSITPDGKAYAFTYWSNSINLFLAEGLK